MPISSTTHRNIREICRIEKEALDKRSLAARIGDTIATRAGQMWFIVLHAIWFTGWIWLNAVGRTRFDPFPYALLTMIVSLESIFLSLFILMSQNRAGHDADRRNHLDLQINLLSEVENTKMLQMLQALCEHHGLQIGNDAEIIELAKRTDAKQVLDDIEHELPKESA